jgi:RNA polymerase sigma-70 factor, ECF subfamily
MLSVSEGAPVQDTAAAEVRFLAEALPLRAELLRTAHGYTRNRHDAEDLVQETYARAWSRFGLFEPGTNIRAWLSRIMINLWMNSHRRKTRRVPETLAGSFSDEEHFAPTSAVTPSAEDTVLRDYPGDAVTHFIGMLPSSTQTILYYADVCQFPLKDVAAMAGVPLGTAMSRRHRAHGRLRAQLTSGSHEGSRDCGASTDSCSTSRSAGGEPVVGPQH